MQQDDSPPPAPSQSPDPCVRWTLTGGQSGPVSCCCQARHTCMMHHPPATRYKTRQEGCVRCCKKKIITGTGSAHKVTLPLEVPASKASTPAGNEAAGVCRATHRHTNLMMFYSLAVIKFHAGDVPDQQPERLTHTSLHATQAQAHLV